MNPCNLDLRAAGFGDFIYRLQNTGSWTKTGDCRSNTGVPPPGCFSGRSVWNIFSWQIQLGSGKSRNFWSRHCLRFSALIIRWFAGDVEWKFSMEGAADGSPAASAGGSPVAAVDGLALANRMVAAAEAAAAAAQATASAANRPTAEDGKSWWKLFPKPPTLDHSTRGGEIAAWKEWSWTFEQYMSSVDAKFAEDIQKLREHPERPIDPVDFNDMEKQRNTFFYSLLSSLLGNVPCLWWDRCLDAMDWRPTELWSNRMSRLAKTGVWACWTWSWIGPRFLANFLWCSMTGACILRVWEVGKPFEWRLEDCNPYEECHRSAQDLASAAGHRDNYIHEGARNDPSIWCFNNQVVRTDGAWCRLFWRSGWASYNGDWQDWRKGKRQERWQKQVKRQGLWKKKVKRKAKGQEWLKGKIQEWWSERKRQCWW